MQISTPISDSVYNSFTNSPLHTLQSPLYSIFTKQPIALQTANFRQSITLSMLQTAHFRQSITLSLLQTAHFRPSITDSPLHSVTDSPFHTIQYRQSTTLSMLQTAHFRQFITLSLLQTAHFRLHYTQSVTDSPFKTIHYRQLIILSLLQTAHFRASISDSPLHSVCYRQTALLQIVHHSQYIKTVHFVAVNGPFPTVYYRQPITLLTTKSITVNEPFSDCSLRTLKVHHRHPPTGHYNPLQTVHCKIYSCRCPFQTVHCIH